jgi:hypothetical protein
LGLRQRHRLSRRHPHRNLRPAHFLQQPHLRRLRVQLRSLRLRRPRCRRHLSWSERHLLLRRADWIVPWLASSPRQPRQLLSPIRRRPQLHRPWSPTD